MNREEIEKILSAANESLAAISDKQQQQIVERASKGGSVSGTNKFKNKTGFFARSEEQIKKDNKKAGSISAKKNKGKSLIKWAEENPELAFKQNSEIGMKQGKINVESGHLEKVRIVGGKNASEIEYVCENCNKKVKGAVYHRWHGTNCKELEKINKQLSILYKLNKTEFNSNEVISLCKEIGFNYKNIKYGIFKNKTYIEQLHVGTNQTDPSIFRIKHIVE